MSKIPKFYLTRDYDGIFVWFATGSPVIVSKKFFHPCPASKTRLPLSWFEKVIPMGKCFDYDVVDLFAQKMKFAN